MYTNEKPSGVWLCFSGAQRVYVYVSRYNALSVTCQAYGFTLYAVKNEGHQLKPEGFLSAWVHISIPHLP